MVFILFIYGILTNMAEKELKHYLGIHLRLHIILYLITLCYILLLKV